MNKLLKEVYEDKKSGTKWRKISTLAREIESIKKIQTEGKLNFIIFLYSWGFHTYIHIMECDSSGTLRPLHTLPVFPVVIPLQTSYPLLLSNHSRIQFAHTSSLHGVRPAPVHEKAATLKKKKWFLFSQRLSSANRSTVRGGTCADPTPAGPHLCCKGDWLDLVQVTMAGVSSREWEALRVQHSVVFLRIFQLLHSSCLHWLLAAKSSNGNASIQLIFWPWQLKSASSGLAAGKSC